MKFKTHQMASVVTCTLAVQNLAIIKNSELGILATGLVFVGGSIGATLSDLDHPNSKIRRFIRKLFTGNAQPTKSYSPNHRREPHMPFYWLLTFGIIFSIIKNPVILMFLIGTAIGVFSHLLIDLFNPLGIPLYGPFSKKKVSLFFIKTGSVGETIFMLLLTGLQIYLVNIYYFPMW